MFRSRIAERDYYSGNTNGYGNEGGEEEYEGYDEGYGNGYDNNGYDNGFGGDGNGYYGNGYGNGGGYGGGRMQQQGRFGGNVRASPYARNVPNGGMNGRGGGGRPGNGK